MIFEYPEMTVFGAFNLIADSKIFHLFTFEISICHLLISFRYNFHVLLCIVFLLLGWKRLTSDSRAIKSKLFQVNQVESFVLMMDQHYIIEHMRENLISPSDLHTCLLLSTRIRSFVFINSFPVYRPR